MKLIYFLYSLAIFLFIISCNDKQKAKISYIDLYSNTITSLNCDNLKEATYKKNLILSDKQNNELLIMFSKLKPAESYLNIDSRLYGVVYDDDKELNFCMNLGLIEINNKKYFVDDSLREYLLILTTKEK